MKHLQLYYVILTFCRTFEIILPSQVNQESNRKIESLKQRAQILLRFIRDQMLHNLLKFLQIGRSKQSQMDWAYSY